MFYSTNGWRENELENLNGKYAFGTIFGTILMIGKMGQDKLPLVAGMFGFLQSVNPLFNLINTRFYCNKDHHGIT